MDMYKKGVCGSDPAICEGSEEAGCHDVGDGMYICLCSLDLRVMDPITGCNFSESINNATHLPLSTNLNKTIIDKFNKIGANNKPNRDFDTKLQIIPFLIASLVLILLICLLYLYVLKRRRFLFRNEIANDHELVKLETPSIVKNLISNPNYCSSDLEKVLLQSTNIEQFEIKSECIKINEEIGEGCFGKVFKGEYRPKQWNAEKPLLVAIKMVKEKTLDVQETKEFLFDFDREIRILSKLDHKNIIKFLGVVRLDPDKIVFSMVFEFMPLGDLNQLLRNCSSFHSTSYSFSTNESNSSSTTIVPIVKDQTLISMPSCSSLEADETRTNSSSDQNRICSNAFSSTKSGNGLKFANKLLVKDLLWISGQISAGMLFLQQHNCTHRDLATRNCLLDENLCVKITDFGMSREIYNEDYYKMSGNNKRLPVRWMAPEAILFGKFTFESDIWSFGVVLYEIFTFGNQPYYGYNNAQAIQLILDGHLLSFNQPDKVPDIILDIMNRCWRSDPKDRIRFSEILSQLANSCTSAQKEELLSSIQMSNDQ